jgi:hypothetical protein
VNRSGRESDEGRIESDTDSGTGTSPTTATTTTPTATATPGTPEYATCTPLAHTPREDPPPEPPAELTTESVADYVTRLEGHLITPPDDEMTGGWVNIRTPTVETVPHGFLAYVPVRGSYINEDIGGETTQHADLAGHIASYFLNERVVRHETEYDERVDPRETTTNDVRCLADG